MLLRVCLNFCCILSCFRGDPCYSVLIWVSLWKYIMKCIWFCFVHLIHVFVSLILSVICAKIEELVNSCISVQWYCALDDNNAICMFDYKFIVCAIRSECITSASIYILSECHLPLGGIGHMLASTEDVLVRGLVSTCTTCYILPFLTKLKVHKLISNVPSWTNPIAVIKT